MPLLDLVSLSASPVLIIGSQKLEIDIMALLCDSYFNIESFVRQ